MRYDWMRIERMVDFYIASLTDRQTLSSNLVMIQYSKIAFILWFSPMPAAFGVGC